MAAHRGWSRRVLAEYDGLRWAGPAILSVKPLVVLSRVLDKRIHEQGHLIGGMVSAGGDVSYSVLYDDRSYETGIAAEYLVPTPQLSMGVDPRVMQRLDLLGRIVQLREFARTGRIHDRGEVQLRDRLLGRPAQVVAIRPWEVETANLPTRSSDLRLTLLFYLDDETPRTSFRVGDVILSPRPDPERMDVNRVSF